MTDERGPLILGAGGRLGRALRAVAAEGGWPGPAPLWHARRPGPGLLGWDLLTEMPEPGRIAGARGVIVLAGVTAGQPEERMAENAEAALAGLALAKRHGLGPVLCLSTAAVYGDGEGPHGEDERPRPATPYGRAKLEMERRVSAAAAGHPVCCLRLANVAGCDALFGRMAEGGVALDRFADGSAPRRAYVGPRTLARALAALLGEADLPPVLNVAQPGTVEMDAVLRAAGQQWEDRPAPETALREMALDTARLGARVALPPAEAGALVAEAREAGWRPAGEAAP